jgi:hypothetical protein
MHLRHYLIYISDRFYFTFEIAASGPIHKGNLMPSVSTNDMHCSEFVSEDFLVNRLLLRASSVTTT